MTDYTTRRDSAVAETLARIDEATRPRCGYCGEVLPPDAPSRDFHPPEYDADGHETRNCQRAWHEALTSTPKDVLDRPDAGYTPLPPAVTYEREAPGVFATWVDEAHAWMDGLPEQLDAAMEPDAPAVAFRRFFLDTTAAPPNHRHPVTPGALGSHLLRRSRADRLAAAPAPGLRLHPAEHDQAVPPTHQEGPMTTPDIAEFIRARLAEDQAAALRASTRLPGYSERRGLALNAEVDREPKVFDAHWGGEAWTAVRDDPLSTDPGVELSEGHPMRRREVAATADPATAKHMARHDPARTLAEVEAKRRLLLLHPHRRFATLPPNWPDHWKAEIREAFPGDSEPYVGCDVCDYDTDMEEHRPGYWCEHVRLLAAPYATHADYRPEWRPE